MKKFLLILGVITSALFFSCSQDAEPVYSCDKNVDVWVKSNLDEIRVMNREDWKKLPDHLVVPVYRAFLPTQKIRFWQQKFEEVKKMKWNKLELEHIQKAEDFLNSNKDLFYDKRVSNSDLDRIESFFYSWQKYAEEELHWDKLTIYSIVVSGYPIMDKKGTLKMNKSIGLEIGSGDQPIRRMPECNCKISHIFACFPTGGGCDRAECEETDEGCGWFWRGSCTGRCSGI